MDDRFFVGVTVPRFLRCCAALRACLASAVRDAALRPSRFNAALTASERLAAGFFRPAPLWPLMKSRSACFRVRGEVRPCFGGGNGTPARRALESPMAIACLVERAPCLPRRICSISSRTNSPACVMGALPSRASRRALSIVFFSGMPRRAATFVPRYSKAREAGVPFGPDYF
jgi:hypothetical protein